MIEIKIEKGIVMPPKRGVIKFPFSEMGIGDSFVCKRNQRNSVYQCAKRIGLKIATRSIDSKTARVWRVK